MDLDLRSSVPVDLQADLLAIGVLAADPVALPPALVAALGPGLADTLSAEKFKGKAESIFTIRPLGRVPARRLLLVGLGEASTEQLRGSAGAVGVTARKMGAERVGLDFAAAGLDIAGSAALVEGFAAGNYKFDRYKEESKRKAECSELVLAGPAAAQPAVEQAAQVARAQCLARDLVNEPADAIYPETLAAFAASLSSDTMQVKIWDHERIQEEGMGGLYAVGRGSSRPPRLVHMHYQPEGEARASVALVGKGVTFDSGGMSLKTSESMKTMRCDMAGSATVIGVLRAADQLGLPIELHGVVGAAENMNAADSYKLGDILEMYDGTTVEVHNTDAEGRLVLADCLVYASQLEVDYCLDLATLTGACVVALGSRYTGLFTEDDELAEQLLAAAEAAGDGLWRLPLDQHFKDLLKAEWADTNHVGPRWGGASTAAAFLSRFVDGPRWAHLDIAGPAFLDKTERYYVKGGTGAMLRALVHWLRELGA